MKSSDRDSGNDDGVVTASKAVFDDMVQCKERVRQLERKVVEAKAEVVRAEKRVIASMMGATMSGKVGTEPGGGKWGWRAVFGWGVGAC